MPSTSEFGRYPRKKKNKGKRKRSPSPVIFKSSTWKWKDFPEISSNTSPSLSSPVIFKSTTWKWKDFLHCNLNTLKDDLEKERADEFLISENEKLHEEVEHARRKADAAETKYRNVINQKRSTVQNMIDKCSEMKEKYKAEMEKKTKSYQAKTLCFMKKILICKES